MEKVLFKVLTGSRLYGTHTEKSDYDYKVVVLPSMDDLLLNKTLVNRKVKPVGVKAGDKMAAGETETEYLPFQVFLDDFFNGQTYALELVFAVNQGLHEDELSLPTRMMMRDLQEKFLTSNVKKMVGYAVSQSQLYGLKTERYTTLKKAVEMLTDFALHKGAGVTLNDAFDLRVALANMPHVKPVQLEASHRGSELAHGLEVVGKKFLLTNTVGTVLKSLQGLLDGYGARVASFDGEGVDWKALSHAVRITTQVLDLSRNGVLEFPNPKADILRRMKNGEMPLDMATTFLQVLFDQVDEAVANSKLQTRTKVLEDQFTAWKLSKLKYFYSIY